MPPFVCPRCRRANPQEAAFCHFDGAELRHAASSAAGRPAVDGTQLPHPFVFPSGRRCQNYDELSKACQDNWSEARELLQRGVFAQFLMGCGRMDLAQAAQKAQAHGDPDIGLHYFLSTLPVTRQEAPRLDLHPRRLALGRLHCGESRQVNLTIVNTGKGLLHGTLTIASGNEWLRLVGADGEGQCTLKTAREQQVVLQVNTQGLAGPQAYNAKITVITNGGIVEVPVSVEVEAFPFPWPPFTGAGSPREMAEQMRKQPKPAVALLENGEVRRWFEANGWLYPVNGPTARSVAAVQQFFEGMGLSKAPAVKLADEEVQFTCVQPETVTGQATLRTSARKWVYAWATSDVPWLRVLKPEVSGPQQTAVPFEVDSSLMEGDRIHVGSIQMLANAGQELKLRVRVDVRRPYEPLTRRLLRPFFVAALLALLGRLALALPADLYARLLAAPASSDAGTFAGWLTSPLAGGEPARQFVKHFVIATWWIGAAVGAVLLWRRGSGPRDALFGLVAGAGAGLAGAASLACVMALVDDVPRLLLRSLSPLIQGTALAEWTWLWTPLWIALAASWWGILGLVVGLGFRLAGATGEQALTRTAMPLARLCGMFGMKRAASYLAMQ